MELNKKILSIEISKEYNCITVLSEFSVVEGINILTSYRNRTTYSAGMKEQFINDVADYADYINFIDWNKVIEVPYENTI